MNSKWGRGKRGKRGEKREKEGDRGWGEGRRMRIGETSQLFEPRKEISANEKLGFLKKAEI